MRISFVFFSVSAIAILAGQSLPEFQIQPDPLRDPWQRPDVVISALKFSSNETVAVIENGYPYFAPRIAPYVGQVYAVNTDPRAFKGRGKLPPGVSPIIGDFLDPHLARLNLDTVIMIDMLGLLPSRPSYFTSLRAGLRKGGRLVIIDRKLPAATAGPRGISIAQVSDLVPGAMPISLNILPFQFVLIFNL